MSTEFFNDQWRIPSNENQNKVSNYSMDFDGTSDFINCGDSDKFSFVNGTTDSPFSLSAWVKPDSTIRFKLFGKFDSSNTNYEYQFGTSSSKNLALTLYNQNTSDRIQRYYNNPLTSLDWQHWVATYDGSGNPDNIKIYINGVQVGDTSVTIGTYTAMQNTAAPLLIASESVNYANGKIDQVSIFDYELSQDQVTQLHNPGYAFNFNYLNSQYINVGDLSSLSGATSVTASIWYKRELVKNEIILDFNQLPSGSGGRIGMQLHTGSFIYINGTNYKHPFLPTVGEWYNYVLVFDGAGATNEDKLKMYVDGTELTGGTYSGTVDNALGTLNSSMVSYIGAISILSLFFEGQLSNASIFSSALTGPQVSTLYNNGQPGDISSLNPLGWWKLDDTATFNSGTSVWSIPDDSTNSNTGTSVGMNASNLVASNINGELIANPMITSPKPIAYYQLGDQSVSTGPTSDYLVPNNSLSDYVFNFGATNESINLGNSFNYPSVVADPWTISFWVKPTNATSSGVIFSGYSVANNRGFYLNMRNWPNPTPADRRLQCIIRSNSSVYTSVVTPSLALNEWTHVAVCYGGGGSGNFPYSFSVYFNNSPVSLVVAGGNLGTPAGSVGPNDNKDIGQLGNTSYLTNAELSELSFLKYKLSANQVDTLYNNGKPGDISSLSPLAWYKLNAAEIFNSTSTEWSVDNNAYPSVYQSSLDFNGSSNYIDTPQIDLGSTNTISFWINNSATNIGTIFGDPNAFGNPPYALVQDTSTGDLTFRLGNNDAGYWRLAVSSGLLSDGNWHHHCLSRNGVTINYYIDGILQTNVTNNTLNASAGTNTTIEHIMANTTLASFASGKLSNFALFDSALTGSQVQTIYNNGTPEASISHSPVSWWKLDNTTTGLIDNGSASNNGTNNGATEYAGFVNALGGESVGMDSSNLVVSDLQQTSGYSPYALNFDGVNDYLNAGSASYLNGLSEFSISVWINLPTAVDNKNIISDWNYNTSPFGHFSLKTYNTSGSNFGLLLFIKKPSDIGQNAVSIPAVLKQGNWHNVVFSYDSGTVTCYVDGSVVAGTAGAIPTTLTSQDGNLTIGNWPGLSQYWPGKLSNIALWSVALTQANATEIYNQGVPGDISSLSPLVWWQLGSNSSFNPNPTGTEGTWTCLDEIGSNNAESSNNMTNDAITDGPGYSASGVGTSSIDIIGDAPYSTANGLSENMDVLDRTLDTPIINTHSIQLDGVDDYIDFGNVNIFERTDAFSGSCWVNLASINTTQLFFTKTKNSTIVGYQFYVTASNNVVFFVGNYYSNNYLLAKTSNTLNINTWYNLAFTYDGSSNRAGIKLYINGVNQGVTYSGPTSITGSILNSSVPFQISGRDGGANIVLDGKIDEVAMFNSKLSAPQVASIYNNGTPNNILPLNPVSWHRFESLTTNGGVVTTADSSGNGLTGTVENGASLSTVVP